MNARELFASKALTDKREGTVGLPVDFADISVLMGLSMEDSVTREIAFIEENKKVVPQYTSIAKKLGGMFYGFYYNPCVYAQNDINDKQDNLNSGFRDSESKVS